ncbi:MAG: hypothetical protein EON95_14235 [Caulobacteraceae bacterium]|nr:MAG: hypothetical protein EON95_14235 [Caulobacteraceae bacterium]
MIAVLVLVVLAGSYFVSRLPTTRPNLDEASPRRSPAMAAAAAKVPWSRNFVSPVQQQQPDPPLPAPSPRVRYLPPALSRDGTKAPTLGVTQLEDRRIQIEFLALVQGKWAQGVVLLPAAGWGEGQTEIGFKDPAYETVLARGSGVMTAGQSEHGRSWSLRPTYATGQGPACLAFVDRSAAAQVMLSGAVMCVMDDSCSRPVACAHIR